MEKNPPHIMRLCSPDGKGRPGSVLLLQKAPGPIRHKKCRHRRKLSEIHCPVFLPEEKQKTRIEALLKLRGATQ